MTYVTTDIKGPTQTIYGVVKLTTDKSGNTFVSTVPISTHVDSKATKAAISGTDDVLAVTYTTIFIGGQVEIMTSVMCMLYVNSRSGSASAVEPEIPHYREFGP